MRCKPGKPALTAAEQALAGMMGSEELYNNLLTLCDDIGPRFAGSDGEHQAARFLRDKLVEYELENVHVEEFFYSGWVRGSAEVEIVQPVRRRLMALQLPYCPDSDGDGEVVVLTPDHVCQSDAHRQDVQGKIVLCLTDTLLSKGPNNKNVLLRELYRWSADQGAIAFLHASREEGSQPTTGSMMSRPALEGGRLPIPAVAISREDGALLLRLLDRGPVRARVCVRSATQPATSSNVIGDVTGSAPGRNVLVIAHYDSHDISVGALDNASGTVAALEIGRCLAACRDQLEGRVRIVCSAAEEIGLLGAWSYVRQHQDELQDLAFVLNLDTLGQPGPYRDELRLMGVSSLQHYFAEVAAQLGYPLQANDCVSIGADHVPFVVSGIPGGMLICERDRSLGWHGTNWVHTMSDTVDKIDLLNLRLSCMFLARMLVRVVADPCWPGRHAGPEEMQEWLQVQGVARHLELPEWRPT